MNEEQIDGALLTETPEITNTGDVRRNSTGKVATRASLSESNNEGKVLPHYLRASTGSCHDFCKHGRKETFLSMERNPTFPKFSIKGKKSHFSSGKGPNQVKIPSLVEKQKISAAKQKAVACSENGLCDRPKVSEKKALSLMKSVKPIQEPEIVEQSTIFQDRSGSSEESGINCKFPSPSKEIASLKGFGTTKQSGLEKIGLCDGTETTGQKNDASRDSETAKKTKHSTKIIHLHLQPLSTEQRTQSAKKSACMRPKSEPKVPSPTKKVISSGKPKVRKQVVPSPANRFGAYARSVLSGKSNACLKSESQPKPTTGIAGRNGGNKIVKNVDMSKLCGNKTLKPPSNSLSPQPPVNHVSKSTSPAKHAKKVGKDKPENDERREKILYTTTGPVATENANIGSAQSKSRSCQPSPSSSSSSSSSSTPLSSSSSVSDHEEEVHQDSESEVSEACNLVSDHGGDNTYISAQNEDNNCRRVAIVHPESKDQTPHKLKFRRGTIVNTQSNNGGTRRLRFRQGRGMDNSQSGKEEVGRISSKMKELTGEDLNHPDPEAQTVALRHHDVQDKKDALGLFNHVIEEAASKLVETRKSKVKALVSAFESVISLQESKPAASV